MKKVKGSAAFKCILIAIEQISLLAVIIAVAFMLQFHTRIDLNDIVKQTSYTQSQTFNGIFKTQTKDLAEYIRLYHNYTSEGVYDPERVVDINKFYETQKIDNEKVTSIGYYVGDLVKWYLYQQTQSEESLGGTKEAEEKIAAKEETEKGEELFKPVNVASLNDYIDKSKKEDRQEIHKKILQVSERVYKDVMQFKTLETSLKSENTNLRYILFDAEKNIVITNLTDQETSVDAIKKLGMYAIYSSSNSDYQTNTKLSISDFNEVLSELATYGDYTIAVSVDHDLDRADAFYEGRENYKYLCFALSIFVIGSVLFVISLIFLGAGAGHKRDTDQIHLNAFDRIKTEVALLMILVLFSSFMVIIGDYTNVIQLIIWAALENLLFLIGYLSFMRRMKAKQLWKNSLVYFLICGWKSIFRYKKITFQITFLLSVFITANFIVFGLIYLVESWVGLFFWMLLYGSTAGYLIMEGIQRQKIIDGVTRIKEGDLEYKINTQDFKGSNRFLADSINHVGEGLHNAIDASMKNERLKTDLITNVSHDIKTPLTSIINYVDLLKREQIENEKVQNYISILDSKSQRLKHLTEDLVEASKISSGNITLEITRLNFVELIHQTIGEFEEKFEARGLKIIVNLPKEPVTIMADSRRIWRIVENLFQNVNKYAMPNTRVYIDLIMKHGMASLSIKNISEYALNIDADELTERFIRGDISRSTEGSGLGLSIAKNLTELQNGTFLIYLDGDLFRVTISFRIVEPDKTEEG